MINFDDIGYKIMDNFGWFLSFFILLALIGLVSSFMREAEQKKEFMTQCMEDHKQYECTAMWRSGKNRDTYVPIPIVIPTR